MTDKQKLEEIEDILNDEEYIKILDVLNLEEAKQAVRDAYQKGRADAIDEFFKAINREGLITNENNLIIASLIAEKIKEQKDETD